MGARTDQAEQRVRAQRALLTQRLDALESRVRSDIETSKTRASEKVEEAGDRVREFASDAPGAENVAGMVREHPLASVLGTFTAGVAFGLMGDDGGGSSSGGQRPERSDHHERRGGESGLSKLMDQFSGIAMASVAGPMRHELEAMAKDTVQSFFHSARRPQTSENGASANPGGITGNANPQAGRERQADGR